MPVPPGAARAVLQFEKRDAIGWIRIDDVQVTAGPNPVEGVWTPYHTADETTEWLPVPASQIIEPKSALDVSFLLPRPAGGLGFVTVKNGRLNWEKDGGRGRFFGVALSRPPHFCRPSKPISSPTGWHDPESTLCGSAIWTCARSES